MYYTGVYGVSYGNIPYIIREYTVYYTGMHLVLYGNMRCTEQCPTCHTIKESNKSILIG